MYSQVFSVSRTCASESILSMIGTSVSSLCGRAPLRCNVVVSHSHSAIMQHSAFWSRNRDRRLAGRNRQPSCEQLNRLEPKLRSSVQVQSKSDRLINLLDLFRRETRD